MIAKKNLVILPFILLFSLSNAANSSMRFIENLGQWDNQIIYNSRLNFGNFYVEKNAFAFVLQHFSDDDHRHHDTHHTYDEGHYFRIEFDQANPNVNFSYSGKSSHYYNYFLGNDESKWKSKVHEYESITYRGLYQGIDLNVVGNGDNIKYTYYIKPQSDASQIKANYKGIDKLVLQNGNLFYKTAYCDITEEAPYAYQIINGEKIEVPCNYKLSKDQKSVSFQFPNSYNKNYELVIDPNIIFARLTGSTSDNFGFTATYDDAGNSYAGSLVFGVQGTYPTSLGAFSTNFNGGVTSGNYNKSTDIGISCYNGNTGNLIYGTYVGGNNNEIPNSIIVNSAGDLVVLGTTGSANFPMSGNPFDNSFNGGLPIDMVNNGVYFSNGSDIVLFKLNSTGTTLLNSTFFGGSANDGINEDANTQFTYDGTDLNFNYGDQFRGEVIIDDFDNIFIVSSSNSSDLPSVGSASNLQGEQDAVVAKFNTNLSTLEFSRYLGGSDDDAGYSMKIDNLGNLFVVGGTKSVNFPTTGNALNPNFLGGDADGFLVKLNSANGTTTNATFLGTNEYDQVYFVDLDENNNVYIVGHTLGNYVSVNATFNQPNGKQFIHKLNNNLSQTIYSSKFGTGNTTVDLSPTAFLVDECERVYVSGWGGQTSENRNLNFFSSSIAGLPLTPDALQSNTDGSDFYFFILDKNATGQLYGSYFGGSAAEHVDGGTSRFDNRGVIHQAICAACGQIGTFPSTQGFSNTSSSPNCNLGIVKLDMGLPVTSVELTAFPRATGCVPLTVNFGSILRDVSSFNWDFGDGNTSTLANPTHTYTDTGSYTVRLIGVDPNSCNESDTAFISVVVSNDTIVANDIDTLHVDCNTLETYVGAPLVASTTSYNWDMGDGTIYNNDTNFIQHQYQAEGIYRVVLEIVDTTKCETTAYDTVILDFPPFTDADIGTNAGCINVELEMQNFSNPDAETFIWDLGNGETSDEYQPTVSYSAGGDYEIYLTVIDSGTCNIIDTDTNIISIVPAPFADFRTDSNYYLYPESVQFTNYSYNYDTFLWEFGDGKTETLEVDPLHFYESPYAFKPCLTVSNDGCIDTVCKNLFIDFIPLIGVPNAFSPNNDGVNDRIKVEGVGITSLSFKIYNRWGELVYEGFDQNEGWDGTYKGVEQEMEVYTYVVNAVLLDGSNPILKGNITLLR